MRILKNNTRFVRNTSCTNTRCDCCESALKPSSLMTRGGYATTITGTKTGITAYSNECSQMQKELMSLYFVMVELELYLDGHPNSTEALARYRCVSAEYGELASRYQKLFGPILARNTGSETEWKWVKEPWPWEV